MRLERKLNERVIAGVCAGLADYFNLDVTIIRLLFVIFALLGGTTVIIYIILWIITPISVEQEILSDENENRTPSKLLGLIFVAIGVTVIISVLTRFFIPLAGVFFILAGIAVFVSAITKR